AQATDLPPLVIAGRRGWQNEGVFGRLDAKPDNVQEVGAVPQDALEALWAQAYALVMPSLVEGFGLPVAEALARGVPVIASDIPSHREVAGERADFLPPDDPQAWTLAIQRAVSGRAIPPENNFSTWRDHFNVVDEFRR
ncbi:MAG TPA: glycosyltransferase, partial [Paracoccaceae bacterium]|nr:glycosyltransferase [Paracoccaceae bacterium]